MTRNFDETHMTICCICGNEVPLFDRSLQCHSCHKPRHLTCSETFKNIHILVGDRFFHYSCAGCSKNSVERLYRLRIEWYDQLAAEGTFVCRHDVVHVALFHLTKTTATDAVRGDGTKFFHWSDINQLIDDRWGIFWDKPSDLCHFNCALMFFS